MKRFPTKCAARVIARVLARTFPLNGDDPETRRRWSTLPAVKIIAALEDAYVLRAQGRTRADLIAMVAEALMRASPRPNGSKSQCGAWQVETTIIIADALAPAVKLTSKPQIGILFSQSGEPTWR